MHNKIFGLSRFAAKVQSKIIRVVIGVVRLLYVYFFQKLHPINFDISKIKYVAHKDAFNLSVKPDEGGGGCIAMAREYFSQPIYNDNAALYIGKFESLFDVVILKEVDTSILINSVDNFVRLEDPRCFVAGGRVFAFCACIFRSEDYGVLGNLSAKQILVEISNCKIVGYKIIETSSKIEKNWVIYNLTEKYVDFVYSILPFKLMRTSLCFEQSIEEIDPCCHPSFQYRNSTNYIILDNIKYSLGHSTIDLGIGYAYLHFFIKHEPAHEVLISRPFIFRKFGNEFAMCLIKHDQHRLAILYSDHNVGNYSALFKSTDLLDIEWRPLVDKY
jgi:hypothetical protein